MPLYPGVDSTPATAYDGASGTGADVAAEYENNSGGPVLTSGLASGLQFDRARNLQGKGQSAQTITATTAGDTNAVFGSAAATKLVQPGGQLYLTGGATSEVVYVSGSFVPGSSATVPLQNPVQNNGQTSARFDVFAAAGPQLNPFTPTGIAIDGVAFYSPNLGLHQQLRAGDTDGIQPTQVPAGAIGVWNGSTFDRWKSTGSTGAGLVGNGTVTAGTTLNAVSANTTGTTVDAGVAQSNWSGVAVAGASPTGGTLTLELSMDGTNWVSSGSTATISAAGNYLVASTGKAARYARCSLTGLTGTISLTVKMMAAG